VKSKVIVKLPHYGSLTVEYNDYVVSIITKMDYDPLGVTDFALYPAEIKELRKALKKAELHITGKSGERNG
jgi:hypothetical protein